MVEGSGLINFKGDIVYTQVDGSVAAIWLVIPTCLGLTKIPSKTWLQIQVIDLSAKL